jgi:peptide/nickel transport system substrate-binding protein
MIDTKSAGRSRLSIGTTLRYILESFSSKQTFVFLILFIILTISALSIVGRINKNFLVYLPESGGTLSEGVMGTPRFLNPILAISDTDKDLSALIYSGLMKKNPDGTIVPDIAESYTISPDGLTYTFTIRKDAEFQDKTPLTANDVIFTVEKIKDSTVKSPLEAIWEGVSVSKSDTDPRIVTFRLGAPYASFLENTTLGILPQHIWQGFAPEEFNLSKINLEAIGSGPYKITGINQNKSGLVSEIKLSSWGDNRPFIKHIDFTFFKSESDMIKAYRKGRIDQISSISPKAAFELKAEGYEPTTATLSRIFGLFFNANKNDIFRDKNVVQAINLGIDKEEIVNKVLYGFGTVIDSPVPESLSHEEKVTVSDPGANRARAESLLDTAGWKKDAETGFRMKGGKTLGFSISTADVGELRAASELMKSDLAAIGINVTVKVFETGMLNQTIIRPRDYEALYFGQIVRNNADLFAFWHSSQRNDPGLNISLYTNTKVDKILEDLIAASDPAVQAGKISDFEREIRTDQPAIFIYAPEFIYMEGGDVQGVQLDHLTQASERFLGVRNWYIRTDAVWKFLQPKSTEQNEAQN